MQLRPYQNKAIDDLYNYLSTATGDPVMVLPTGSGKSVIIAALCADAINNWPSTQILMLTHVKELIEQNYRELKEWWPNAPAGVYSAGLNRRELHEPITFGGIQSLRGRAGDIGHIDILLIDEAHLVSHKNEGMYRKLIKALRIINPAMRVVGLTATPYRLGHGLITSGMALFDEILEPMTVELLVYGGYLTKPVSRATDARLSADGVHKRGGEYIESELQSAVDVDDKTVAVAGEICELGADRRAWLVFCAGVKHAYHMRDALRMHGVSAETITGETPQSERDALIEQFKSGAIRALTNANVLTTGFNYPGIDLIALCRPTLSPGLYVQMVGRGMRVAPNKKDCLVLDFAGVVATHGPITNVRPPSSNGDGDGIAPVKECPECHYLIHASLRICEFCGHEFPPPEPSEGLYRREDDVYSDTMQNLKILYWEWIEYTGKKSGKKMLRVTYHGSALSDRPIHEYLVIWHDGYAGAKAMATLKEIAWRAGVDLNKPADAAELCRALAGADAPAQINYKMDGKFPRIISREWVDVEREYDDLIPF